MSTKTTCDGCLREFSTVHRPELSGRRREDSGGAGLPSGEFHLCFDCAVVALHAAATLKHRPEYTGLAREIYEAHDARRRELARKLLEQGPQT